MTRSFGQRSNNQIGDALEVNVNKCGVLIVSEDVDEDVASEDAGEKKGRRARPSQRISSWYRLITKQGRAWCEGIGAISTGPGPRPLPTTARVPETLINCLPTPDPTCN